MTIDLTSIANAVIALIAAIITAFVIRRPLCEGVD